ncbi:hypothetical protein DN752_17895 [Echinicola strongylocentroti]|uniref:Uncharacterized protein n=1 Tax=Echinicola strongylocentroti TaxID=1795355 RepID=A0A2Z4IN96_9BACT|nr:hypothetical protein [Echinicola strongylocentroti]AWW31853.1 hypothetical protein DN752_17895 [Echinicola strongylocentroti]
MKAYDIPVSRSVLKMLRKDYGYRHHMRIDQLLLGRKLGNVRDWDRHLKKKEATHVTITVVCRYAGPRKLYAVSKLLENHFNLKMMLYVEAAVEFGSDAAEAIRSFMEKYDLSEEDLKMETAYKRWQRHQKREIEKELIPLW